MCIATVDRGEDGLLRRRRGWEYHCCVYRWALIRNYYRTSRYRRCIIGCETAAFFFSQGWLVVRRLTVGVMVASGSLIPTITVFAGPSHGFFTVVMGSE